MKKLVILLSIVFVTLISAKTFPDQTGIVLTDLDGKTYDIDKLIKDGKHIFVHQMYSG